MATAKKMPPPYSRIWGVAAATPLQPRRSNMVGDSTISMPGREGGRNRGRSEMPYQPVV